MVNEKRFFQRARSVEIPTYELQPDGVTALPVESPSRLSEEDKAAITRKFMNTPVYPSRLRNKGLQAKRGGKPLPHPMRSAE